MRNGFSKYLSRFLIGIIFIVSVVVVVNLVVDPLRIYKVVFKENINKIKPRLSRHLRMAKPYYIQDIKPDVIILGTSRTEYGIDPDKVNEVLGSQRAFNAGISGAMASDLKTMFMHTVDHTDLKHILIGTDFFMFNSLKGPSLTTPEIFSRIYTDEVHPNYRLQQFLYSLLSWDMFDASIATLSKQDDAEGDKVALNGQRYNQVVMKKFLDRLGFYAFFLVTEKEYSISAWSACRNGSFQYSNSDGSFNSMEGLRDVLNEASSKNIPVTMFVGPMHGRLSLTMDVNGFWELNEQWKRDMVALADEYESVEFWDFAMFNELTTEQPPAEGDQETYMNWYMDPSHFRDSLGDVVLETMFGDGSVNNTNPTEKPIGFRLSGENIDEHLSLLRKAKEDFRENLLPRQEGYLANIQEGIDHRGKYGVICKS